MFKIEKEGGLPTLTITADYANPNGLAVGMYRIKKLYIHDVRAEELLEALIEYFAREKYQKRLGRW